MLTSERSEVRTNTTEGANKKLTLEMSTGRITKMVAAPILTVPSSVRTESNAYEWKKLPTWSLQTKGTDSFFPMLKCLLLDPVCLEVFLFLEEVEVFWMVSTLEALEAFWIERLLEELDVFGELEESSLKKKHLLYGAMEAEFEVQRTIKRAELTAFLCLLKIVIGPIKVHLNNKGKKPRAGDADLWIKIWEELHGLAERCILVEVEHVKAHRTKKEKTDMSHFEKFVTEGNEKADELAKRRSIDGWRVYGVSKTRSYAAGKRGGVRSLAVCSQLPLRGGGREGL